MGRKPSFPGVMLLIVGLLGVAVWWLSPRRDALVVYCAHDAEFSEPILKEFEKRTGIPVVIQFDTEATKSLSLIQRITAERGEPQCDVFWNNETLGTIELAREGLLEEYKGAGYERIPEQYRDPQGLWGGFGARFRVVIFNKDLLAATEENLKKELAGDLSKFAIAKPMFGTTLTHYSVLWNEWGGEKLKGWHRETRERGIQEVAGNGKVKDLVAGGNCRLGFTDTDDYFTAVDAGKPVAMLPVRTDGGKTICIPNTVGIIKGTKHQEQARKLADFLLSEEIELRLAKSPARQVPLGPVDEKEIPADVVPLKKWVGEGVDLRGVSDSRRACLEWLREEYLQ